MNGNPNKKQQNFHGWCRGLGCIISGNSASIHHIRGSRFKLKGVAKPGEWMVLPLSYYYHQGDCGIHTHKLSFEKAWGTQKELYIVLINKYQREFNRKPMEEFEYNIILERGFSL